MAVQFMVDEVKNRETYLHWLQKKSGFYGVLSGILYEINYDCRVDQDKIQVDKAKELRREYAVDVGVTSDGEAVDKLADRLWKSIHGPCSLLEMMVYLAKSLNENLNETEEDQTNEFFKVLLENSKLNGMDDDDYEFYPDQARRYWLNRVEVIQKRLYRETGEGGFFPLRKAKEDMRNVPIWYQLNAWLEENSDDEGQFLWKNR